ncbi:MAG TPA: hypothetical protein VHU88_04565 [Sporichthyaceae bacterium]|jgi:hypothetical protein|nr:hypothetical protein [Sporichthyaceae bacterium]
MIGVPFHRNSARRAPESDRRRALPGEGDPTRLDAGRWRAALPEDAWPADFPTDGAVWRRDVFAVAARWRMRRATSRQLLAAVLMWSQGSAKHGRRQALRILANDPTGHRLDTALSRLRSTDPTISDMRTAFLRLRTDCRLEHLESDAATQLLYFAGYRRGGPGVQPLMLDAGIAGRLPVDAGVTSQANRGTSLEWIRWICWAAAQAGEECEPELIEMDLATGGLRYGAPAEDGLVGLPRQVNRRWIRAGGS